MKNELEKKKYRICGFVGIDPNTDSFKWLSDEFDSILDLFHQEQTKLIEEFEGEVKNIKTSDDRLETEINRAWARGFNEAVENIIYKLEDLKKTL